MSRRIFLAIIAAITFAVAVIIHPPGVSYACSCVPSPPVLEARDGSEAVFSGTVAGVAPGGVNQSGQPVLVTFDVKETWKGPNGPQVTIGTSGSSASCGYEFVAGEEYLVYANVQDGQFNTNLCSRTVPLANAGDDLAALGPGAAPNPGVVPPTAEPTAPPAEPAAPTEAGLPLLPIALGGVALAAVAALAVAFGRRRA